MLFLACELPSHSFIELIPLGIKIILIVNFCFSVSRVKRYI